MNIFVMNSGSSSIRFRTVDTLPDVRSKKLDPSHQTLWGKVQKIGSVALLQISRAEKDLVRSERRIENHQQAFEWLFACLNELRGSGKLGSELCSVNAIAHRVVHGGPHFSKSTFITEHVRQEIECLNELAPLHNPACLAGIDSARTFFDDSIPMVAVFDTMFHHTIPEYATTYAIPWSLTKRHQITRYGFHGIAHASLVTSYACQSVKALRDQRVVTFQLGSGCSVTAIDHGKSLDTSMGFSPCEGLMMGTRSGDIDPSLIGYLVKKEQVSVAGVQNWLNEHSGLLGVSGRSSDMRQLLEASTQQHDMRSQLAIEMFCYRAKKYLGAFLAVLQGADAILFGGGIGENAPEIRTRICQGMEWCGIRLDDNVNRSIIGVLPGEVQRISQRESHIDVCVVGTDEETMIAQEAIHCLQEIPPIKKGNQ